MANMGLLLSGQLAISSMSRLATTLHTIQGMVNVELEFGRDEGRTRYLRGRISAELTLVCQRCLQPMTLAVQVEPCLGLVTSADQIDSLPDNYEPLLVESHAMSLAAIVEDELLLGLPVAPKHTDVNCTKQPGHTGPDVERKNPFAVLNQFKQTDNQ